MSEQFVYYQLANTNAVTTLVADRIYPDIAPTKTLLPYVTFQRISTPRIRDLKGLSGLAYPRFQIDAWATSRLSAKEVIDAVRAAFDGQSGNTSGIAVKAVSIQDEAADIDAESGLYRARADFYIWHNE